MIDAAVVRSSWAEFATLYGVFSTTAQIIARRKYPKGDITVEFDFDDSSVIAEIYHGHDSDYLRIPLHELETEFVTARAATGDN